LVRKRWIVRFMKKYVLFLPEEGEEFLFAHCVLMLE
jgi:hypothetical protein